eukprot:673900-Ditylum_brightwellii.AAC.3
MVNTTHNIGYKKNVFEYPELTCIHGKLTTANILTLCNEICANAQAVITMLGGGANRHLGLVCNAATYSNILGTHSYTRPILSILNIPAGATQYVIAHIQEQYTKDLCQFRATNNVERTVVQ